MNVKFSSFSVTEHHNQVRIKFLLVGFWSWLQRQLVSQTSSRISRNKKLVTCTWW